MVSRMSELAPRFCVDCAEYHLRFALTRYVGPFDKSVAIDRALLIEHIQRILSVRSGSGPVTIFIAGAADTGVLATCAHAVATLGEPLISRCRFIVLDRCRSPLTLCAEFASRHGIHLRIVESDIETTIEDFPADIIVAHSFLRFMDRRRQINLLKRFDGWLKPQGRVLISQSIRPQDGSLLGKEVGRLGSNLARVKAAVDSGAIKLASEAEPVFRRLFAADHDHLTRVGDVGTVSELRDLLCAAGLREHSVDIRTHQHEAGANRKLMRVRAVAVFSSSREA